jgi:hypothetical protein
VLDVTALRQLKPAMAKEGATLLAPAPAVHWRRELTRGSAYGVGDRHYFGENPEPGAHVYYTLTKKVGSLRLVVQDYTGKTVASLPVKNEPGLHRSTWNLRSGAGVGLAALLPSRLIGAVARAQTPAPPGQYRVVLTVDRKEQTQGLRVENDPALPAGSVIAEQPPGRQKDYRPED